MCVAPPIALPSRTPLFGEVKPTGIEPSDPLAKLAIALLTLSPADRKRLTADAHRTPSSVLVGSPGST